MKRALFPAMAMLVAAAALAESSWKTRFLNYRSAAPAPADRLEAPYFGVTVWRLRASPQDREGGQHLAVGSGGVVGSPIKEEGWTPRKFPADTPMARGQKFVLTIEVSHPGYLAVFRKAGSERVAPSMEVTPGQIVQVPASGERPAYFTMGSSAEEYAVLFSPKPLANPGESQMQEWAAKWPAAVASQTVSAVPGAAVSAVELLAAHHAWALRPGDPPPLTIYHCSGCPPESPQWFGIELGGEH